MKQVHIKNSIDQQLVLTIFETLCSRDVLVIAAATGVKQGFYKPFAGYFASRGITVITFDYTGIGQSLNGSIKALQNNAADWGEKDLEAVIQYAELNYSGQRMVIMGHSIGGQLIGLAPSSLKAQKIILIAAQTGYWKYWKGGSRIRMWMLWHIVFPVLISIFGYMPSGKFSRMESLPGKMAWQWSAWCRKPGYLFADVPYDKQHHSKISCPIISYSIADDKYAPTDAVKWLTLQYTGSSKKIIELDQADYAGQKIGHFGIFNDRFKMSIWQILLEEIQKDPEYNG